MFLSKLPKFNDVAKPIARPGAQRSGAITGLCEDETGESGGGGAELVSDNSEDDDGLRPLGKRRGKH